MSFVRILAALLALAGPSVAAERWVMQYFHDTDESTLVITDLQFATVERGMAVGYTEESHRQKPAGLVTVDAGRTWNPIRPPDPVVSLFLLDQNVAWAVGRNGIISRTEDFGQTWKSLARLRDPHRLYFHDENRGWAVGARKSVWETTDGGKHWHDLPAAGEVKTTRDYTVFSSIAFANPDKGMITGWSKPPRRDRMNRGWPDWMDPSDRPREWPSTMVVLETQDSGAHWTPQVASIFGRVTRVRLAPDGRGLGVIEFMDAFEWPGEVSKIDWKTGKSSTVFRRKDRLVTDAALPPDGPAYLASIQPAGTLAHTPVPGKLRMIRSANLSDWVEMPIDYRAVARRAVLAAPDKDHVWVATDTGMILKLAAE